jgi:hypothetical protein
MEEIVNDMLTSSVHYKSTGITDKLPVKVFGRKSHDSSLTNSTELAPSEKVVVNCQAVQHDNTDPHQVSC